MTLEHTDRRRIFIAAALTLIALPALWWANQSENSSAPNVATVGVGDVAINGDPEGETADDSVNADRPLSNSLLPPREPTGVSEPVFLDGPSGQVGSGLAEVAVPAKPRGAQVTTTATFRSSLFNTSTCIIAGIANGTTITVVNLDNNRSTTCVTTLAPSGSDNQLVLHTRTFAELADLTDAPIPVEITL